jgi:hypothetical protein
MSNRRFDLNDIEKEPTDEDLSSLMADVVEEAKERSAMARQAVMLRVREEITAARKRRPVL